MREAARRQAVAVIDIGKTHIKLGRKRYWLQQADAHAWHNAEAVLTYPQHWAWRLTGTMASEVTSLGCHSDLWCPMHGKFSSLVEHQNWSQLFPPKRPAWQSM